MNASKKRLKNRKAKLQSKQSRKMFYTDVGLRTRQYRNRKQETGRTPKSRVEDESLLEENSQETKEF